MLQEEGSQNVHVRKKKHFQSQHWQSELFHMHTNMLKGPDLQIQGTPFNDGWAFFSFAAASKALCAKVTMLNFSYHSV